MNKILEEIEKNPELKAKMEELDKNPKSTPKDFIQAVAEYGIELKEEDFKPASPEGELQDDELDAVAGGGEYACACVFGGGGTGHETLDTCACVLGGGGECCGQPRCICILSGYGDDEM